jgi:hypothetical protein
LQPGEILVSYTPHLFLPGQILTEKPKSARETLAQDPSRKKPLDQTGLLNIVRDLCDESANDITGYLARLLTQPASHPKQEYDRSMILIKNIRKAIP